MLLPITSNFNYFPFPTSIIPHFVFSSSSTASLLSHNLISSFQVIHVLFPRVAHRAVYLIIHSLPRQFILTIASNWWPLSYFLANFCPFLSFMYVYPNSSLVIFTSKLIKSYQTNDHLVLYLNFVQLFQISELHFTKKKPRDYSWDPALIVWFPQNAEPKAKR